MAKVGGSGLLQGFVILFYIIGFPLVALLLILPSCEPAITYADMQNAIVALIVMAALLIATHILFKRRPELKARIWTIGTVLLIVSGLFLCAVKDG